LNRSLDRPRKLAVPAAETELASDAKQGRQKDAFEQAPLVVVDLAPEARISCRICRRHFAKLERTAVGKDEPLPHQQQPPLTVADIAVVTPDQPRTLRD